MSIAPELDENQIEPDTIQLYNLAMDQFFYYMETTYVGYVNKRTQNRGTPLFPVSLWNKHNEAVNESELTTNSSESWNSVSKPARKGNLWSVMNTLKKEDGLARGKLVSSASGTYTDPNPSRTKKIAKSKARLSLVVKKYSSMLLDNWLDVMASLYEYEE